MERQYTYRLDCSNNAPQNARYQVQGLFLVLIALSLANLAVHLHGIQHVYTCDNDDQAIVPALTERNEKTVTSLSLPAMNLAAESTSVGSQSVTASSPACQPSFHGKTNITRIYFSHTRKAAGTALRAFLAAICKAMNWELVINEARYQEYPNRTDTLYVVNLREPIERIISQYKYEGRWSCRQIVNNMTLFVPTVENQKSLEVDLDQIMEKNRILGVNEKLWRCAEECYSQWYTEGYGKTYTSVQERYLAARERLLKYDVIVPSSFLRDSEYLSGLEALFGNLNTANLRKKKHKIYCSEESAHWNKEIPMGPVNSTTMQQLQAWNKFDTKLYTEMTSCGGAKNVVFPDAVQQKELMKPAEEKKYFIMAKMPGEK